MGGSVGSWEARVWVLCILVMYFDVPKSCIFMYLYEGLPLNLVCFGRLVMIVGLDIYMYISTIELFFLTMYCAECYTLGKLLTSFCKV